ncbi:MAG: dihydrolipoyl dehydrogenase [Candidatus Heimdallarchaeota archaeon]|nr:dihydrolipoyl dehydrogenase [Candidatus Heimdallarchaeota archaeon]
MKKYDIIAIGTGSAMNIISGILNSERDLKVAVIDKDEPGGICLTRGCIPTKILLYSAEVVTIINRADIFGVNATIKNINFQKVMERMRSKIYHDINNIQKGLTQSQDLDYYQEIAEFVAPYTLKVGDEQIKGEMILLCIGSKPTIPLIKGLDQVDYHTSDSILKISKLPKSLGIIGGGYIAAEYGFFFAAMGSEVTIIGRNKQFVPQEEPEVSALAKEKLSEMINIHTNFEVIELIKTDNNQKKIIAVNQSTGEKIEEIADEVLIAAGRSPTTDILHPEKSGIETDEKGWIKVNDFLETTKPNIWAFGDATGKHLFKHTANYESQIVYYNAFSDRSIEVDYHAVPHAVFTHPEIASVGMLEKEAIEQFGEEGILIGFQRFEDTAKGDAMELADVFVKIILEKETQRIFGASIIGPQASVLIQEIINLMYTRTQSIIPIHRGMHIHPALSEVVERAALNIMPVHHYHHLLEHLGLSKE